MKGKCKMSDGKKVKKLHPIVEVFRGIGTKVLLGVINYPLVPNRRPMQFSVFYASTKGRESMDGFWFDSQYFDQRANKRLCILGANFVIFITF